MGSGEASGSAPRLADRGLLLAHLPDRQRSGRPRRCNRPRRPSVCIPSPDPHPPPQKNDTAAQVPIYDFKQSRRSGYQTLEVPPSRIVVIEGIYALSEKLRPLLDLRVSITGAPPPGWRGGGARGRPLSSLRIRTQPRRCVRACNSNHTARMLHAHPTMKRMCSIHVNTLCQHVMPTPIQHPCASQAASTLTWSSA